MSASLCKEEESRATVTRKWLPRKRVTYSHGWRGPSTVTWMTGPVNGHMDDGARQQSRLSRVRERKWTGNNFRGGEDEEWKRNRPRHIFSDSQVHHRSCSLLDCLYRWLIKTKISIIDEIDQDTYSVIRRCNIDLVPFLIAYTDGS